VVALGGELGVEAAVQVHVGGVHDVEQDPHQRYP
jgi:hypothetical protein